MEKVRLEAVSRLNKRIVLAEPRWKLITETKHPEVIGKEEEVKAALESPDEIRESRKDEKVHLHYKKAGNYSMCVVTKSNGEGFVITAYLTDRIKEGKQIYKR